MFKILSLTEKGFQKEYICVTKLTFLNVLSFGGSGGYQTKINSQIIGFK